MLNSSEVNNWIGILTVNFENTLENWTGSTENNLIGSDLLLIISPGPDLWPLKFGP